MAEQAVKLDPKKLPRQLRPHTAAIEKALARPLFSGKWPEDADFVDADQAEALGRVLAPVFHSEVETASIAYLFKEKMSQGERVKLGKAKRAGGELAYLTDVDFVLVFNWSAWGKLAPEQRIALVDHELSHCGRDDEGQYSIVHHDVEEFASIVSRYGLWTPDLHTFGQAVKAQLEMFS